MGPSKARWTAPAAHHRRVIEVDLSSDDEPMPIAVRKGTMPPPTATVKRGTPRVISTIVIGNELRQQLYAVRSALLNLSTPVFDAPIPTGDGPAQEPGFRRCQTLVIAPLTPEVLTELETPSPSKEPTPELRPAPANAEPRPVPTGPGYESWDTAPGTPAQQATHQGERGPTSEAKAENQALEERGLKETKGKRGTGDYGSTHQ